MDIVENVFKNIVSSVGITDVLDIAIIHLIYFIPIYF